MALNGIGATASGRASAHADAPPTEPRALVPVPEIPPAAEPVPLSRRPAAPFLAHLIATARGEPQTCERRRAAPETAAQAFAAAAARLNGVVFRKI
jgi:hypothetical protein